VPLRLLGVRVGKEKRGLAFTTCVAVLRPPLMVLTKRDWHGTSNIPADQGCVVVSNHISHFDPLTFAHFVYDSGRLPRFLAKAAVLDLPVIGRLIRATGQIPVYRLTIDASKAYSAAVEAIGRGQCVVVYPEGTITRDPGMWPMTGKTGAARIALATGCPVIPTAQWGAHKILPPYTKVPHFFPRKTIHVRAGPPVDLSDFQDLSPTVDVLAMVTARIMDAITDLLAEIRNATPPEVRYNMREHGRAAIGNPNRPRRQRRGA
jgi:1-acyl-sn-glycerol-3-phosphate acyltransferase